MRLVARIRSLWRSTVHRNQLEVEMDDELRFHLDHRTEDLIKAGTPLGEAKRQAKAELGSITALHDDFREAVGLRFIGEFGADFRYAASVFRRTPTLAAVAILTLAVGIAATTTVFGWIDGLVLHPFRGATDDGQLAVLESVRTSGVQDPNVSYADCRDFEDSLRSISGLLLNQHVPASVGDGEHAYSAWFEVVSGNYFDALGVKPILGRTFTRDEYGDRAKAFTAVISYRLWQDYFRGDPSILGRTVHVNRLQVTIVGVAPPEFHGRFHGGRDGRLDTGATDWGGQSRRAEFPGNRQAETRGQPLRGECRSDDSRGSPRARLS